ncbi:MAG: type restriction enzyme subunit [Alphaproteobacteria bacterium]|nr:type restriction enzyme subunit [Alphaproteobacteria bacterium]
MRRIGLKESAAIEPIEGPWTLPEGWRWERLSTITSAFTAGKRPSGGAAGITEGRLSIGGEHLRWDGSISFDNPRYIPEEFARSLSAAKIEADDILIVKDGATTGKTAYYSGGDEAMFVNEHVFIVRIDRTVAMARFVFFWLWSRSGFDQIMRDFRGAAQGGIGRTMLDVVHVPLPSLDAQRRIVARIEELFAEVDDGEAALAGARNDLATWHKALLKAAVAGYLTADWRAANPPIKTGAGVIARILAKRRTRWNAEPRNKGKCYLEPAGADASELGKLPDGWEWGSVAQLGNVVTGGTPPTSNLRNYDGDIPFFTPSDLDAGFRLVSTKRTIGEPGLAKVRPIPARSILVTCIGATIGKVAFNAKPGATNQQINTIIPAAPELAEFIFHYFDGPGRRLVVEGASSTTMPILNKGDFSKLAVPVPPLAEAQEISALITEHYEDVDAASAELTECRRGAAALRQSILAAAFRGELAA